MYYSAGQTNHERKYSNKNKVPFILLYLTFVISCAESPKTHKHHKWDKPLYPRKYLAHIISLNCFFDYALQSVLTHDFSIAPLSGTL